MARADAARLRAHGAWEPTLQARADLQEAIRICRSEGEPAGLIVALQRLGRVERDLDVDVGRARVCYQEAADLCRRLGDRLELGHCRRHLGELDRQDGALEAAESNLAQALLLYRDEDAPALDIANTLRGLALTKEAVGDPAAALGFWREARDGYAEAEATDGVAEAERRMRRLLETV